MTQALRVSRDRARCHRVAAMILAGFESDAGLAALRCGVDAPQGASAEAEALRQRLRHGLVAAIAFREGTPAPKTPLAMALTRAALLLREGLFFEVHEVLESVWRALDGSTRMAVQGLIQVAVGLHHCAHGNMRGAASLLAKGRAKLERHGHVLEGVDIGRFLDMLRPWERAVDAARWPEDLAAPWLVSGEDVSCARARPPSE